MRTITNYGYTARWYGGYTHLLHLRARWYAPESGTFLSVDPVESEPPYTYVRANPVNLTDPSGKYPPPECKTKDSKTSYRNCVLQHYGLRPITKSWFKITKEELGQIEGTSKCDLSGPVEYQAPGYLEGLSSFLFTGRTGVEVLYDFATMERSWFGYSGIGLNDSIVGGGVSEYAGVAYGFTTNGNINDEYKGPFLVGGGGLSTEITELIGIPIGVGAGAIGFTSPDFSIKGFSWYDAASSSVDLIPNVDLEGAYVEYEPLTLIPDTYIDAATNKVNIEKLVGDIRSDDSSPWRIEKNLPAHKNISRGIGIGLARKYGQIYNEIHDDE